MLRAAFSLLFTSALAGLFAPAGTARAQEQPNPYDALQASLAREAARDRGTRGDLALFELWANVEDASPDATRAALDAVSASRTAPAARRDYAASLRARQALRDGDLAGARERVRELGYVTAWQVAGPFDDEGKRGFARAFGPEAVPATDALPLEDRYPGKEREVRWRSAERLGPLGYVDLGAMLRPRQAVCAYAATTIESERAAPLALHLGAGGAVRVFWNGEVLFEDDAYRQPDPDRSAVMALAHAGTNRLLVKVCAPEEGGFGFFLRLRDRRGR
ncbi:MAG: hypothetical protein AAF447_25235, partial [Myxococcota bacterium]